MPSPKIFPKFTNPDFTLRGAAVPAMSCKITKIHEKHFFDPQKSDISEAPPKEADFMERAGTRVTETVLKKLHGNELSGLLVLIGKGHNGGDALIAARKILSKFPKNSVPVKLVFCVNDWDDLAPLTMDAYEAFLREIGKKPTFFVVPESVEKLENFVSRDFSGVILDGIFGYGFRPPMQPQIFQALLKINELRGDILRVAVDLPSGISDREYVQYAFRADLTCALGVLKTPLLEPKNDFYVGEIEICSVDFPLWESDFYGIDTEKILEKIPQIRSRNSDKRSFGHLLIVGGSRKMPGALLMNVLAALRSGIGLVSVLCPESVQPAFAAHTPEAMWIPCKENADGGLDFADSAKNFRSLLPKIDAILVGSGMGRSRNSQALIREIASETPAGTPLILDADALFPENIFAARKNWNTILLPHEGEFARISGTTNPAEFCKKNSLSLVLKKPRSEIFAGKFRLLTSAGTPLLARGGSGDILAGIVASLFAQNAKFFRERSPDEEKSTEALATILAEAVCWHGAAARELEKIQGQISAEISKLPAMLFRALSR